MVDSPEMGDYSRGPATPEISLSLSPEVEITERQELIAWLQENRVDEVECVTPDFAGVGRGKVMPILQVHQFQSDLPADIAVLPDHHRRLPGYREFPRL